MTQKKEISKPLPKSVEENRAENGEQDETITIDQENVSVKEDDNSNENNVEMD